MNYTGWCPDGLNALFWPSIDAPPCAAGLVASTVPQRISPADTHSIFFAQPFGSPRAVKSFRRALFYFNNILGIRLN
jgi:hypothetical protein